MSMASLFPDRLHRYYKMLRVPHGDRRYATSILNKALGPIGTHRLVLAPALALLIVLLFSAGAFAFHQGGVGYCEGCHALHESRSSPGGGSGEGSSGWMIKGADPSSTCLRCLHRGRLSVRCGERDLSVSGGPSPASRPSARCARGLAGGCAFGLPSGRAKAVRSRPGVLRHPERSAARQVTFFGETVREGPETFTEKIKRKIDSSMGRFFYGLRLAIVEPVFGNITSAEGLRRFTLRGKRKVTAQWRLYCIVHNLGKIHRYAPGFT